MTARPRTNKDTPPRSLQIQGCHVWRNLEAPTRWPWHFSYLQPPLGPSNYQTKLPFFFFCGPLCEQPSCLGSLTILDGFQSDFPPVIAWTVITVTAVADGPVAPKSRPVSRLHSHGRETDLKDLIDVPIRHSLPLMPPGHDLRPTNTIEIGTRVTEGHSNFETAYNMLTGIRFCVSRCNAKIDHPLTPADFREERKVSFDVLGTELTPATKYDFKFKDYAPWAFRKLRDLFRVDQAGYLISLTEKYMVSELGSPGKSGSFFYFSRDYKYIIKTIHHHEAKTLKRILPHYYNHIERNPDTLLSQYYGLHRVKTKQGRKFHFVVMNNLFPPHKDIHLTFDLKGSMTGRETHIHEKDKISQMTLKDRNWMNDDMHLQFGPEKAEKLKSQLEKDVRFLQTHQIMDYSMLIGIHNLTIDNSLGLRSRQLKVFAPSGGHGPNGAALQRTQSSVETARQANQLRQRVKAERPVPVEQTSTKLPEHQTDTESKKQLFFYNYHGGIRTSNNDNSPDDDIYYMGIIDLLTRYSFIKRAEHFFKTLGHPDVEISAIPPLEYGQRFLKFLKTTIQPKVSSDARRASTFH